MWVTCAFLSAFLIGLQDIARKQAVKENPVFLILLLNLFFCSIFLLPFILSAQAGLGWFSGTWFDIGRGGLYQHWLVLIKALIVLASWACLYFSLKYLPITLTAPIHATYPILTLIGAMIIFGERLNGLQGLGIAVSVFSLFLLKRSGAKEGIFFARNKWIWLLGVSALLSAASGLYDKFLMQHVHFLFVQSWYTVYQFIFMAVVILAWKGRDFFKKLHWNNAIIWVSIFMVTSEFFYLYSLRDPEAMISIVSMIRRSSVLVTFVGGAWWFGEKNLRSKAVDLVFVLIGMILLGLGSY